MEYWAVLQQGDRFDTLGSSGATGDPNNRLIELHKAEMEERRIERIERDERRREERLKREELLRIEKEEREEQRSMVLMLALWLVVNWVTVCRMVTNKQFILTSILKIMAT